MWKSRNLVFLLVLSMIPIYQCAERDNPFDPSNPAHILSPVTIIPNKLPVIDSVTCDTSRLYYVNDSVSFIGHAHDSDGVISQWQWSFSDSSSAVGQSNLHQFASAGNHSAILTVTDDSSAMARDTVVIQIIARPIPNKKPVIDSIRYTPTGTIYVNDTVTITGFGHDSDGVITSWQWQFGDSSSGPGKTTRHAYALSGNYNVILSVTDDSSAIIKDTITLHIAARPIPNKKPVIDSIRYTPPGTIYVNDTVTFTGYGHDSDGVITSWQWQFGDITSGTGKTVKHAYTLSGDYSVILSVTDDSSAIAKDTVMLHITTRPIPNKKPVIDSIRYTPTGTIYVNDTVTFTGYGHDSDGVITSWQWLFGDLSSGTGKTVKHAYTLSGNYNVILTVTDDSSAIAKDTVMLHITTRPIPNKKPVIDSIRYTPTGTIYVNDTVTFTGYGHDSDGVITSWQWQFGNDSSRTGKTAKHAYKLSGNYNVILTVTDDSSAIVKDTVMLHITTRPIPNKKPVIDSIRYVPIGTIYVNDTVTFTGYGHDSDGVITSWQWQFGDTSSSIGKTVKHAYTLSGDYNIILTVTDDSSTIAKDTVVLHITTRPIPNKKPVIDSIRYIPIGTIYVNDTVTFTGYGHDSDGVITSWQWQFGDITSGTGKTVKHAYTLSGNYNVILTVTDDSSAIAKDTVVLHVTTRPIPNKKPVIDSIRYTPIGTIYVNDTVTFTGYGHDSDGVITSWQWQCGDTSSGIGKTVKHAYKLSGNYNVILTVTDDSSAIIKDTIALHITARPIPNKKPVIDSIRYTPAGTIYVTDTVTVTGFGHDSDGVITSWQWQFGDDSSRTGKTARHAYRLSGNYNVILSVSDDSSAIAKDTVVLHITTRPIPNKKPVIDSIRYTPTGTIYVNDTVTFTGFGHDSDGVITSWQWQFGDDSSRTGKTAKHAYKLSGNYNVILSVTDDSSAITKDTIALHITARPIPNKKPVIDSITYYYFSSNTYVNDTITFTGHGHDSDGVISSWQWQFGDAISGTGKIVQHFYTLSGSYNIILTVTDDSLASSQDTLNLTIRPNILPRITLFSASPETVYIDAYPDTVIFHANAMDSNGYIANYSIDFGDSTALFNSSSSAANVRHVYHPTLPQGFFNAILKITDDDNAIVRDTLYIRKQ